jgi:ureidoglycolate lyase
MDVQKANTMNFRKYGKVVNVPEGSPTSQDSSYKFWSDIANYKIEGETEIGICTVFKQEKISDKVERHLNTPEILIPIDAPFILPVLEDGKEKSDMEFFEVGIGEAVVINEAVWHGACLPVNKNESSYFVIFRRNTPGEDVEKR